MIAHNGEINTLRGNLNWMHARESMLESECSATSWQKMLPILDRDGSDSATFDNALQFLVADRPLAAARDADDDPRGVAEARVDERGAARPSTSTTPA